MKKIFLFLFLVVLLFNTAIFAEDSAAAAENDVVFSCRVYPEYGEDYIAIKLSDISAVSSMSFSFNPESGFLLGANGAYEVLLKPIDSGVELNNTSLVLRSGGANMEPPGRFRVFTCITWKNAKISTSLLTEAVMQYDAYGAELVLRKIGTSRRRIGNENINEILEDNMLLVNKSNTLDKSYIPPDLVYSKPVRGRSTISLRLDRDAMEQLNYMLNAAYLDGVSGMVITSAYRTYEKQTSLFNNKTSILSRHMSRTAAAEEASKVVAVPGSSEHQTGLAADICSEGVGLVKSFAETRQGKWLKENSWKFGYIIRYPLEKTEITGIIYEPWHVRYVGDGHSEIMKLKDMCLEEYVDYLKANRIIHHSSSTGEEYFIQYIEKQDTGIPRLELSLPDSSEWSISVCTKDSYILTIRL